MSQRALYVAAYDVSNDARLAESLKIVRAYATGGQKSAYECFLNKSERRELIAQMHQCLDLHADRFALVRLDPRAKVYVLGIAVRPKDPAYFYVGWMRIGGEDR